MWMSVLMFYNNDESTESAYTLLNKKLNDNSTESNVDFFSANFYSYFIKMNRITSALVLRIFTTYQRKCSW